MAEDIISVTDIASAGVVIDTPPIALAPNVFTDVRNVRFKDGAVRKIEGELLLNNIVDDLTVSGEEFGQVRYFAVWENPNLAPTGCYYIWVVDYIRNNIVVGQKVYIQDHQGTQKDLTPSTLPDGFGSTNYGWQHTLFSGGFAFIINNGINKPHYILDTAGNNNINDLILAELPGWDSYNVEQTVYNDTYSAGASTVFDLGQIVDFTVNQILVTGTNNKTVKAGNPAGTGTENTANFVPGALPSTIPTVTGNQFEIYTDTATNTTVIVVGGLTVGDTVTVTIESRNPVNVRCGIVESFGDLLVAGDLTEVDSTNTSKIIRRLSGVVRTSDVAVPGSVPNNWNPFAAGVSTADEFTLSETNVIQEMKSLQGNMYIYSTDSIHVMRLTGNTSAPVSFAPNTDEYGCLTTGAVVEYDGKHFVVGANDIYTFAGNPGNIQSLSGKRVKRYFYDNLNPIHERQLFTLQNHQEEEIWICYPTLNSTGGECDEALIWNYRDNTWTIRDLNNVAAGDVGPIKGGGIPTATIVAINDSGNAGYTNRGKKEVQEVTINGKTPKKTNGYPTIKEIAVGTFTPFVTDLSEEVEVKFTGTNTGPQIIYQKDSLTFPSSTTFTYDRNKTTHLDGGASAIINGDSSIGSVSFPASAILGTNYADGATITMSQFVEAVKDYINANNALADFTANAASNVLTLTSDVPGERVFSTSTFAVSGSGTTTNITPSTITTGNGIYGVTVAQSPAVSIRVTAPAVSGVHAAIDETVTLTKNQVYDSGNNGRLWQQLVLGALQARPAFSNTSSSQVYSLSLTGLVPPPYGTYNPRVKFTSVVGGNHSALTFTYFTEYQGTTYGVNKFGGNISGSPTVTQQGVDNSIPFIELEVTSPSGAVGSVIVKSDNASDSIDREAILYAIRNAEATSGVWYQEGVADVSAGTVTFTKLTNGPVINNFGVTVSSTGSFPTGFSNSLFTSTEIRAGRDAHTTTDTITLTPPVGTAISVNFDSTNAYDPDGSAPDTTEEITATEIATALEAAWTDTTYFTVSRTNEVLTFTSVNREAIAGSFAYTVTQGASRTGTAVTPLIADSTGSDISITDGVDATYAKLTRVTITVNTTSGSSVIFDRHYGEGPGRLLDPTFTPAANDDTYGDTAYTNDADYLNAYYDPDKTQDAAELAKPNGTVSTMQSALLAALAEISTNNALIVTPDSTSAPTQITISPSQFSATANYVTAFSPDTEVIPATVAPTTAALTAVAEGITVPPSTPTQDTTGTNISTTFDIVRSWSSSQTNPNKIFPIFAQSGYVSGTLFNRIRAADLGYDFGGTPYVSYAEREQLSITPNFDTETLNSIAVWADGGTITTVGGTPQRATLQIRARATNNPGELPYLTVEEDNTQSNAKANRLTVNDFIVADSYKTDLRITGRFLNYRIDDADARTNVDYTGSNTRAWSISGFQLGVNKGGVK